MWVQYQAGDWDNFILHNKSNNVKQFLIKCFYTNFQSDCSNALIRSFSEIFICSDLIIFIKVFFQCITYLFLANLVKVQILISSKRLQTFRAKCDKRRSTFFASAVATNYLRLTWSSPESVELLPHKVHRPGRPVTVELVAGSSPWWRRPAGKSPRLVILQVINQL